MEFLKLLAGLLARQVPTLVVAVIGLWFAVARRQSLGRVSTWAVWGFGSLIAYAFVSVLLQSLLINVQAGGLSGDARAESLTRLSLWGSAAYLLFLGGLVALTRAVFLDRDVGRIENSVRQSITGAA
jgi:hypothetical protein